MAKPRPDSLFVERYKRKEVREKREIKQRFVALKFHPLGSPSIHKFLSLQNYILSNLARQPQTEV
jgi:hypothetical protein